MKDKIVVMDINTTERASVMLADVFSELQRQMIKAQIVLESVAQRGSGDWLDVMQDDVELLQLQLEDAANLSADISDYLHDMVSVFRGDSAYVDGDDFEDFE